MTRTYNSHSILRWLLGAALVLASLGPVLADESPPATPASSEPSMSAEPASFQELSTALVREAVTNSREINRLLQEYAAKDARVGTVGEKPDPMVALSLMSLPLDSFDLGQEPMTQLAIGFQQKELPPQRLRLMKSVAAEEARMVLPMIQMEALRLVRDIRLGLLDIAEIDERRRILSDKQKLLRSFAEIAVTRYSIGQGSQADLFAIELEIAAVEETRLQLERRRIVAVAMLNGLAQREDHLPIPELPRMELTEIVPDADALLAMARVRDPKLAQLEVQSTRLTQADALAVSEYDRELTWGLSYAYTEKGTDFLSAEVMVSLPELRKGKRDAQRATLAAQQEEVEAARGARELELSTGITGSTALVSQTTQEIDYVNDGLIPLAVQSLDAAIAAYSQSQVDYNTLIMRQGMLFQLHLNAYSTLIAREKELVKLRFFAAEDLPELADAPSVQFAVDTLAAPPDPRTSPDANKAAQDRWRRLWP